MLIWTCEKCGRKVGLRFEGDYARCTCSQESEPPKPCCIYRGPQVATGSCKCGPIFSCPIKQHCGDFEPVDRWVDVRFTDGTVKVLDDVGYQQCSKCDDWVAATPSPG